MYPSLNTFHCINANGATMAALLTFMPLVFGFALRTRLITILPLVLVTWTANRKCTYMASDKGFSIHSQADIITTDLADLGCSLFYIFGLNNKQNNSKVKRDFKMQLYSNSLHSPNSEVNAGFQHKTNILSSRYKDQGNLMLKGVQKKVSS